MLPFLSRLRLRPGLRDLLPLTATGLLLVALAGCGGDDNPAGPGGPGTGPMTASIDGQPFVAGAGYATAQALPSLAGGFALSGTDPGSGSGTDAVAILIYLYNVGGPGTYPLGVGPSVFGGIASIGSAAGGWGTPGNGADGTVTITALSPTQIAGTFSFTATASVGGATGTKVVTEGAFDLTLPGTALLPLPDNAGSRLFAEVGGTAVNSVNVVASPANGNLLITGGNFEYGVGINIESFTGEGVYPLTNVIPLRTVTASIVGGGSWGPGTGATGTIEITSATATRVVGTFSGTLAPLTGTTTTIEVTAGSFSVGLP